MKLIKLTLLMLAVICLNVAAAQAQEICDNRIDDDGDGLVDCLDPDCADYESCWQCETEFYQVHSNNTLVALEPGTGTYTVKATITGAEQINGAQFNHVDGHVYAPVVIDGKHTLGMLSQNGRVASTGLTLPGNGIFYCGAISLEGVMYLSNSTGIHAVDLTQEILKVQDLGLPHSGVADFSLDLTRGLFYGITGANELRVFDPYSLELKSYPLAGTINNDKGGYGAAWSCNDGSFFAYNNKSGKIYSVNVNDLTATEVLNATGNLSINDGFNCVLAPPPFETDCTNGIDDDGDGLIDCEDPDCYNSNVCTVEICDNGIDDDLDGWADCDDSECFALNLCLEICDNGIDDNNNGLIDGDDPQCGTSGGISGGLESNRRLSDKISLRNFYTKVIDPKKFNEINEGLIPFDTNLKDKNEIVKCIPKDIEGLYVAESTPSDLINITNATKVAGADYYEADQRVATVLGLYTEQGVYEHTKYICDRVDGSRLLDVSYLFAKGGNFISYELLNNQGQQEFAVSFSAYLDENNKFQIENHWNLNYYSEKKDYFNFQIWADNYSRLIELLESTIENMEELAPIDQIKHTGIPRVFVSFGQYENGTLKLIVKNKNKSQHLRFTSQLRRIESGPLEEFNRDIKLNGENHQIINLKTGPLYDIGASLKFDGLVNDAIFLADGAWGIDDQNPGAKIDNYEVVADERINEAHERQVERGVSVKAEVKDYLNIYRSLHAKLNPQNIAAYNSLAFTAGGTGQLEVTIVKSSIDDWQDQYRTYINLEKEGKEVTLFKEDFESRVDAELDLEDVTMVVFTLTGNNQSYEEKELKLTELRFQNSEVVEVVDVPVTIPVDVYPNPVKDFTTVKFESAISGVLQINVLDNSGQVVITKSQDLEKGENSIDLNMSQLNTGMYYYQVLTPDLRNIRGKISRVD